VPSHFFVPDPEIFPQLEGLKLEADDKLIYVFNVDADSAPDDSKHPMVSVFITDTFIGEEVNPEKKHHQAYTPMGERNQESYIKESTEKRRIGSCQETPAAYLPVTGQGHLNGCGSAKAG
jgi:hypothetical protein